MFGPWFVFQKYPFFEEEPGLKGLRTWQLFLSRLQICVSGKIISVVMACDIHTSFIGNLLRVAAQGSKISVFFMLC